MNALEYAQQVNDLFAVPSTALRVKRLIDDEVSDARSITQVLSADPGAAAHILRVANSAIYRFPRKIDSLQRAVQVIGTNSVFEYALVFGISNAFMAEEMPMVDLDKFWEHAVSCAVLCRYLAKLNGMPNADRMFIVGLLHNIGELAVIRLQPATAMACAQFNELTMPKDRQYKVLGFTYAEVSAALCQQWMLPDNLVSTIAMQHHDELSANAIDTQVIQLASEIATINTYDKLYDLQKHLPAFLFEGLNLNPDDIELALDHANSQVEQLLQLFNPDVFSAA